MTSAHRDAGWILWACLALFALRVLGQLETVLLEPRWLPDMDAWYSGLLPYPILLPVQIAILMVMAVVAWNPRMRRGEFARANPRGADALRLFAGVYFAVMALRLAVNVFDHRADFWTEGAIPVAFHWVLALFILVSGRRLPDPPRCEEEEFDEIPHGDVPALTPTSA